MAASEFKKPLGKKEVIGFIGVGLFVIIIMAMWHSKPDIPKLSDHDAFLNFYRTIMARCAPVDNTYRPFADAMGKGNWMEAAQIAKRIKDPIHDAWYNFSITEVPTLSNKEAQKSLDRGKDDLELCYYNKMKIVEKYLELIKNPSASLDAGSDILNSSERVQSLMTSGLISLIIAGQSVGVTEAEMKATK